MRPDIATWISRLGLQAHPEGGFYRESYRSTATIPADALPADIGAARSQCTAIYYLLRGGERSHFHRLKADEIWHFYDGDPLRIFMIHPDGRMETQHLGLDFESGEALQFVVPAHTWFAAEPIEGGTFSLVGCTMAPGFDFADFELATRENLGAAFPQHCDWIGPLCAC